MLAYVLDGVVVSLRAVLLQEAEISLDRAEERAAQLSVEHTLETIAPSKLDAPPSSPSPGASVPGASMPGASMPGASVAPAGDVAPVVWLPRLDTYAATAATAGVAAAAQDAPRETLSAAAAPAPAAAAPAAVAPTAAAPQQAPQRKIDLFREPTVRR